MKIYNTWPHQEMGADLEALLTRCRSDYPDSAAWIEQKVNRIAAYMQASKRDTAVVAVSGGIDSALVFALAMRAKAMGALNEVVAISLPIFAPGATNQEGARDRAQALVDRLGGRCIVSPLEKALGEMAAAMECHLPVQDAWARGQLVAYMRTPALYYATSLLTASGARPVILGTTNRDEGAYIGYFGKASDGMVDVQVISDLPKSQVRAQAALLGVDQAILEVAPSGDMYDGRVDEEVFGAPYDFVELDTEMRLRGDRPLESLSGEARAVFQDFRRNIETMHTYNAHKYLGASPAVHLDVVASTFADGWHYRVYDPQMVLRMVPEYGDHKRW